LGLALISGAGNIYYVDSGTGASGNTGENINAPMATIDQAVGKCTASQGDVIVVLQGHTETISAATSLVCDIAGVTIIGLGVGAQRPLLTYTTAAGALLSITAADVKIQNIRLLSNFTNGITSGITIAATGDGAVLDNIEFNETANTKEWLIGITVAAAAHDVTIKNCRYHGIAGGTTSSIISAAGAANNLRLIDNYLHGDCSAAAVKLDAAASTDLEILRNRVINIDTAAGLGIAIHNSSTGFANGNHVANLKDTVAGITGTGMAYCENYCTNALNASGIIIPAVDS